MPSRWGFALADPLWRKLEGVKAGDVYEVSDAIRNTAGGIIAGNLVLDDIEEIYDLDSTR